MRIFTRFALLSMALLLLAACDFLPGTNTSTRAQLPDLANYTQHEGEDLADQLSSNEILNTLLMAQPQLAAVAEIITQAGSCAQDQGVVNWRVYVHEEDPAAAGVVIIASQNQATNPQVILGCGISAVQQRSLPMDLSPCTDSYSYQANDDTYYVFYAASKEQVCSDFQSALPPAP